MFIAYTQCFCAAFSTRLSPSARGAGDRSLVSYEVASCATAVGWRYSEADCVSREFFTEVEERAQSALTQSSSTSGSTGSQGTVPPSRQLPAGGTSSAPQSLQMQPPSPDLQASC